MENLHSINWGKVLSAFMVLFSLGAALGYLVAGGLEENSILGSRCRNHGHRYLAVLTKRFS